MEKPAGSDPAGLFSATRATLFADGAAPHLPAVARDKDAPPLDKALLGRRRRDIDRRRYRPRIRGDRGADRDTAENADRGRRARRPAAPIVPIRRGGRRKRRRRRKGERRNGTRPAHSKPPIMLPVPGRLAPHFWIFPESCKGRHPSLRHRAKPATCEVPPPPKNPMSHPLLAPDDPGAVPIRLVTEKSFEAEMASLSETARAFAAAQGFEAKPGAHCLLPGAGGALEAVLFGLDEPGAKGADPFLIGKLPT